jgi:hypothetical protein
MLECNIQFKFYHSIPFFIIFGPDSGSRTKQTNATVSYSKSSGATSQKEMHTPPHPIHRLTYRQHTDKIVVATSPILLFQVIKSPRDLLSPVVNRIPHTHPRVEEFQQKKKTPKVMAPEMPIPISSPLWGPGKRAGFLEPRMAERERSTASHAISDFSRAREVKRKSNPSAKARLNKKPPVVRRSLSQ